MAPKVSKEYFEMQQLCRMTISYAEECVKTGMNLQTLRSKCEQFLLEHGADSFWWFGVGAFTYAGDETAISYVPDCYEASNRIIEENDIITIDLSPQKNGIWGDYARTIILEEGEIVKDFSKIQQQEWRYGLLMEEYLHGELLNLADTEMTFEELYRKMNDIILQKGYINLDCLGNLGHSIELKDEDRIYIEDGNKEKLSSVGMFTFEPHISVPNSKYGFKKENIYYFEDGKLKIL